MGWLFSHGEVFFLATIWWSNVTVTKTKGKKYNEKQGEIQIQIQCGNGAINWAGLFSHGKVFFSGWSKMTKTMTKTKKKTRTNTNTVLEWINHFSFSHTAGFLFQGQ